MDKYYIYCETDNKWESKIDNIAPSTCPVNPAHTVRPDSVYIEGSTATPVNNPSATTAPTVNDDIAQGYNLGSIWVNSTTDIVYCCVDNTEGAAIWTSITASGGVFGNNFQTAQNTAQIAMYTSDQWVEKQRLTTPSLPSGTYRIGFEVQLRHASGNDDLSFQVQVNDTTTLINGVDKRFNPQNGNEKILYSGFDYYTGSGVLNIDIDVKKIGYDDDGFSNYSRIEIWRVS